MSPCGLKASKYSQTQVKTTMSIKSIVRGVVVAAMAALGLNAWAESTTSKVISFNWSDQTAGNATAESGVFQVAADAWNNFSAVSNTRTGDLKMWNGSESVNAGSSFSIRWASNVWWGCGGTDTILKRYLDDGVHDGIGGVSITVSNIPFKAYDVYIICSTDQGTGGKYLPWTVNGASYGGTTWGDTASLASCVVGENTLKVAKQSGTLVLQGAQRNGSQRGCICALQIVEAEATIVNQNVGSAYTATEAEALEGDIFNLTFDAGATLTLDKDLTRNYNLISEGTITLAGDHITAANLAKLGVSGVAGGVVCVIDTAAIPEGLTAPTAGWIYRYVGETALTALPFASTAAFSGTIEIACPVSVKDGDAWATLPVANNKNYVFADDAQIDCKNLQTGNNNNTTQTFVQNGGTVTAHSDNNGDSTSAAVLLSHYGNCNVSYALNGGTLSVPDGALCIGWDGNGTMSVGGDADNAALLQAKGINCRQRNNTSSLTVKENGTVEILGDWGIKLNTNKKLVLNGGTLKFDETCRVENGGTIDLTANSTVNVAEGKTVTIDVVLTGTGDLIKTGAGTLIISKVPNGYTGAIRINEGALDAQGNRNLQNIVFAEGTTLIARESTADDGTMTITGVSGTPTIKLYNALGEEIPSGSITVEGTTITATFTPTVAGKGCWMDYEFKGSLTNIGTDTTGLTRDGSDFGEDASSDFKTNDEGEAYALYTGTHPYRGVTYPTEWSCAIYCSVPDHAKAALITFGTLSGGLIGLISGTEKDQVLLVRTTGNSAYEVLATMAVPNAATAQHLYTFSKTAREIKVYLDGKLWTTYTSKSDITFGGGMQIASVHGGVGSTGIVRFDKALFNNDIENETLRKSLIGMMRLYNAVLGPKAAKILSDEFPYVSPNGLFTREVSEDGTWSQEDAWSKVLESGSETAAIPEEGAVVKIATASDETVAKMTVNVESDMTTEELEITGGGIIAFDVAEGSGKISNSGATTIDAAVTIKYGALDISGGPLTLGENGSVAFDFSACPIATAYNPETVFFTGITERNDDLITAKVPSPDHGRALTFEYDTATQRYVGVLEMEREAGDLAIGEGDVTIADSTVYTDADGNEAVRFYDEDWIVVSHEQTLTIGENLTHPAKIKVVDGGVLTLNFGSDVTQTDFMYNATVRVEEGGVYDIANANGHKDYSHPIVLAGGKLTNSGIATTVDARQYWQNSVVATSTIDVSGNEFGAVKSGHNAYDYNLGGNVLTKTGAGQFTFKTANFVGGGTLAVEAGTFVLDNCTVPEGATLDFVVASGATIIVKGNQLAKTGTVTGSGTVIYENGVDTSAIYQDTGWTGTLWIKGMNWNQWDLGREGTAGSSLVKLTGFTGYAPNSTTAGCNATVELVDNGATKAISVNNGYSTQAFFFKKIIGSGTFTATSANTSKHIYKFHDVSEFTGKLEANNIRIVVGNGNVGDDAGTMAFTDGIVINGGLNWSAAKVTFGDTLKVKGKVGDAIVTVPAAAVPSTMPAVTLIDAEGEPVEGEYTLEADGNTLKVVAVQVGPEPIDPTQPKTYDTDAEATAAAEAINANKTELIAKPFETMTDTQKAVYDALVTAKVVGNAVVIDFGETGVTTARDSANNALEAADILDTEKTEATVEAIPGLYYAIIGGTDVSAITTSGAAVQAVDTKVTLEKPNLGTTNSGFYKVQVSVTAPAN